MKTITKYHLHRVCNGIRHESFVGSFDSVSGAARWAMKYWEPLGYNWEILPIELEIEEDGQSLLEEFD